MSLFAAAHVRFCVAHLSPVGAGLPGAAYASADPHRASLVYFCLNSLALHEINKLKIADHDVVIRIVHLAQEPDLEVSRLACGALANLAENTETHPKLLAASGGPISRRANHVSFVLIFTTLYSDCRLLTAFPISHRH